MPNPTTADMGRIHEEHVAQVLGGHKTGSSGNQWDDQTDGFHEHDEPFAFRWDGKSTKGKSITITTDMLEKVTEQAQGERPALPLMWYGNEKLTVFAHDWIAVKLMDFSEVLEAARQWAEIVRETGYGSPAEIMSLIESARKAVARERATAALEERYGDLSLLDARVKSLEAENQALRVHRDYQMQVRIDQETQSVRDPSLAVPGYLPRLPWTIVNAVHANGAVVHSGLRYDAQGYQSMFEVASVRVERLAGASNRPRLVVNDVRIPDGDLYVDGKLRARACKSDPDLEVG